MSVSHEKVCPPGMFPAGVQPYEGIMSMFRVVCTLVTLSITSSWYSQGRIGRRMLLFLHWIGGVVHLMAGLVMAQMILNCWVSLEFVPFIKTLKFLELAASNLVAVTNLAICANLAFIVHCHRTMSRLKSLSPFRMVFGFLAISMGCAVPPLVLWAKWAVTGSTFFSRALSSGRDRWITLSYVVFEAVASVAMTIIVVLLLLFRRSELCEVWHLHRRIKYHVALTTIALLVDLFVSVGAFFIITNRSPFWLIIVTWVLRYVHIALDTLVLYSALETPVFHLGRDLTECAGIGSPPPAALRY